MAREPEGDTAWNNFLRQHHGSPNAENFVRPFFLPMTTIARGAEDLTTALDLTGVSGSRLDLVGSIVGASRYIPQGITLAYFGFISQSGGRGFGQARMRQEGEPMTQAYNASDIEYRTLIKAKIALNNGRGTADQIAEAAKIAFNAPVASARDAGPAQIELWVGRIPSSSEGLGRVIPDMLPRAAGISINIVFWSPFLPFGFSDNNHFGFGVGIMARTPIS